MKAAKPTVLSQTAPAKTEKAAKESKKKTSKESSEKTKANDTKWMIDENDEDNYPVYPHENHLLYDVRNGYDIHYDPFYTPKRDYSHYDRMFLGEHSDYPLYAQMHPGHALHIASALNPHVHAAAVSPLHGSAVSPLNQDPVLEEETVFHDTLKYQKGIGHGVHFPESPHISTFHDGHATYHIPTYGLGRHQEPYSRYSEVHEVLPTIHDYMPHAHHVSEHITAEPVDIDYLGHDSHFALDLEHPVADSAILYGHSHPIDPHTSH